MSENNRTRSSPNKHRPAAYRVQVIGVAFVFGAIGTTSHTSATVDSMSPSLQPQKVANNSDSSIQQLPIDPKAAIKGRMTGTFGCSLAISRDMATGKSRSVAVGEAICPHEKARGWAVWMLPIPTSNKKLAVRHGNYRGEAAGITLCPVGDIDHDGLTDVGVLIADGALLVLSGRDLKVLLQREAGSTEGAIGSLAWLTCASQPIRSGLLVGYPLSSSASSAEVGAVSRLEFGDSTNGVESPFCAGSKGGEHVGSLLCAVPGRLKGSCDDVLVGHLESSTALRSVSILSGMKDGNGLQGTLSLGPGVERIGVLGDIDGDGRVDVGLVTSRLGRRAVDVVSTASWKTLYSIDAQKVLAGQSLASFNDGEFGAAMCSVDDCDGDGVSDIAIGAPTALGGSGMLYVFSGKGGKRICEVFAGADDRGFGSALVSCEDLDGDGCGELLVGSASLDSVSAKGGLYTFSGKSGKIISCALGGDVTD